MSDENRQILLEGMQQLKLDFPCEGLLNYLSLLHKWNQAYNLTAIRDMKAMVTKHLLDSLAILPWLHGSRILDVGTGAGLPGIPLAIARPDLHVVLLDSNGKKARFLQEVKRVLALNNIDIMQTRVENYYPTQNFDTVTSRAFSDLQQMLVSTHHLIAKNGIWLAMKGKRPEAELANVTRPYKIEQYTVAGLDEDRCCVIVQNKE